VVRVLAAVGLTIVVVFAGGFASARGGLDAACSRATAQQLATRFEPGGADASHQVEQVLCGAFAGSGSTGIAVSFHYPGCIPLSHWAVFAKDAGSDWRLVLARNEVGPRLSPAGSAIRVTWVVFRPGDPRCIASGGEHSRVWSWDGQRFVGGPTTQSKPPTGGGSSGSTRRVQFASPSGNLLCFMTDRGAQSQAYCQSFNRPSRVYLNANGALSICRGQACPGNPGEGDVYRPLAYGAHRIVGPFRCDSLTTGMRCVVISSGIGFLIDSRTVTRIG
jgi:hypothetical protein